MRGCGDVHLSREMPLGDIYLVCVRIIGVVGFGACEIRIVGGVTTTTMMLLRSGINTITTTTTNTTTTTSTILLHAPLPTNNT